MRELYPVEQVSVRQVKEPPLYTSEPIDSVEKAAAFIAGLLQDYDREVFGIINLRTDGSPINFSIVSMGTLSQSLVHPRELLKTAFLSNADSLLIFHNHPSGDLTPSKADIQTTKRLQEVCALAGIPVRDHIIVGNDRSYFSFLEKDLIEIPNIVLAESIDEIDLTISMVAEDTIRIYSESAARERADLPDPVKQAAEAGYRKESNQSGQSYDWKAAKEKREQEVKDITKRLEAGIRELFESDQYKAYLSCLARFPNYSLNNSLLIYLQRPDASLCNSYSGWKRLGRHVKKGEHGIRIFAPAPYKVKVEQEKKDPKTGQVMRDSAGQPLTETVVIEKQAFKVVSTFSLDQTEGKELPRPGVTELNGDVKGYETLIEALMRICPVPVTFEEIASGAKGYYSLSEDRIVIQSGMSELQTLKTFVHECTHNLLHSSELPKEEQKNAHFRETEAEAVAYTCLSRWGCDCSEYSFMYLGEWASGRDLPELRESLQLIRDTSCRLITDVEDEIRIMMQEKNLGELDLEKNGWDNERQVTAGNVSMTQVLPAEEYAERKVR